MKIFTTGCTESEILEVLNVLTVVTTNEEVTFPVEVGTEIAVRCADPGRVLRGSNILICRDDGQFKTELSCADIGN